MSVFLDAKVQKKVHPIIIHAVYVAAVMPYGTRPRQVVRALSGRSRVCFESNQGLFRVEAYAASTRSTHAVAWAGGGRTVPPQWPTTIIGSEEKSHNLPMGLRPTGEQQGAEQGMGRNFNILLCFQNEISTI
jgi:hypothetical protein